MQRLLIALLLTTIALSPTLADDAAAPDVAAAPAIGCDEPAFNFGTVSDQEEIRHVFVIKNTGNANLIIGRVHATCGCTTATPSANTVPPGGSVDINATLSLRGRSGDQHKTIYVESNDPLTPQFQMSLRGSIQRETDVRPQQVMLQVSPTAMHARMPVTVVFNTAEGRKITAVDTTNAPFCTATVTENVAGRDYTVVIATVTNLAMKSAYLSGSVTIFTDNPNKPRIDLPVMLHQLRDVVVAPNQLTVSTRLPAGTPFTQQILVRSRTTDPLTVVEITPPAAGVDISTNKLTENMYRLEVVFHDPTADLDGKTVGIRVQRPNATEEFYEVPIRVVN